MTGVDDDEADGSQGYEIRVTATSSDADYEGKTVAILGTNLDDDDPLLTAGYGSESYTVSEGGQVVVEVTLSASPEQMLIIPVIDIGENGASSADYWLSQESLAFNVGDTEEPLSLTFNVGDTEEHFTLKAVADDDDDDGERVRLAFGGLPDGVSEGVSSVALVLITEDEEDPLPQAWLANFGGMIAAQAVDAVGDRLAGGGGTEVALGGRTVDGAAPPDAGARTLAWSTWLDEDGGQDLLRSMTGREFLLGSAFRMSSGGEEGDPLWTAWGRFAASSFDAEAEGVDLSGDVTTGFLGADVESGRWLGGFALGFSEDKSLFRLTGDVAPDREDGTVRGTLAAFYPYVRFSATERLDLWAMGGIGRGAMTIAGDDGSVPTETDIGIRMGAVGVKGAILDPSSGDGFALHVKSDLLMLRMQSEAVRSATGDSGAEEADVSRLRLVLEGSRSFALGIDGTLTPAFEAGIRRSAGDAAASVGIEFGGHLSYTEPGVTVEGTARRLVVQDVNDYDEWGVSAQVRVDPGESGRGLSFRFSPVWGVADSTTARLWGSSGARGPAYVDEFDASRRLEAEVGYGLGFGRRSGVATPYVGLELDGTGTRTWRLGARWAFGSSLSVNLEGVQSEGADKIDGADQRVGFTLKAHW